MIKIPRHPKPIESESEDSYSSDNSEQNEDRVRAIKIDENKNQIHQFSRRSSIQQESEQQDYQRNGSQQSQLEVSDSGSQQIDQLERRIRKMQNNLQRNLKNLSNQQIKHKRQIPSVQQNSNIINLTQKSLEKTKYKPIKQPIQKPKPITIKQKSKKLKQNIKQKCDKAMVLRKDRQDLAALRNNILDEFKGTCSSQSNGLAQIQRQLNLLKMIESLEIKVKGSINKKVSTMHDQIEKGSVKRTKSSKEKKTNK